MTLISTDFVHRQVAIGTAFHQFVLEFAASLGSYVEICSNFVKYRKRDISFLIPSSRKKRHRKDLQWPCQFIDEPVQVGKLADLVLWKPEFFGAKPEIVIKGGTIAWAQMGDANGSIPTPEPVGHCLVSESHISRYICFLTNAVFSWVHFWEIIEQIRYHYECSLWQKRMKPMFGATGKAGSLHSIAFVSQVRLTLTFSSSIIELLTWYKVNKLKFYYRSRFLWPALLVYLQAAEKEGVKEKYNLQKKVEAVRNTRQLKKTDMKLNSATPDIDVDPTTFRTTADGVELTCQPASYLPLAQNYFLF